MSQLINYESQEQKLSYLKNLAKIAADSKQYSNQSEVSLLNLMMTAQDMGISPMKAINGGFYIVNGKVCMSTSLMADRIRKAGHSIKIIEMSKDKCVIIAVRKDENQDSLKMEYTIEEAHAAGLTGSPTWKKFPKIMLYNRCMSSVARILFSDVVGNSYSEEERFDLQGIPSEKRPIENQETEIEISEVQEIRTLNPHLTEEQCARLDTAILDLGDEKAIDKITTHLGIDSIYDIDPKDYDKVMRALAKKIAEKRIKEVEGKENE